MNLQTFHTIVTHHNGPKGFYTVQARTKGDAIMEAQRRFVNDAGLDRKEQSFCNVEFEPYNTEE